MKSVRALYGMVLQRGLQYERVLHLGVTESE